MTLCPCDAHNPPMLRPIAPGLARLPRQIGLFGQFRADLLARVRTHPALSDWRARDAEDFGLMLFEFWAYVSDVTAFYTYENAQDLYLNTANGDQALRRLVALIDHVPRPAVAAEAILATLMDGSDPVEAPAGAGFLSDAIEGGPPQVFEASTAVLLDPLRNGWELRAPRDTTYRRNDLLIEPATRSLTEGSILVFDTGSTARTATRVTSLVSETALNGANYVPRGRASHQATRFNAAARRRRHQVVDLYRDSAGAFAQFRNLRAGRALSADPRRVAGGARGYPA